MNKILLGALIGLGIAGAGIVFAATNPFVSKVVWNNATLNQYGQISGAAVSQVSSFVSGADTCYILENINKSGPTQPIGISCIKN